MTSPRARRGVAWAATATAVAGLALLAVAAAAWGPARALAGWEVAIELVEIVPIVLGWLVVRGAPNSPVGPALAWTGAAVLGTRALELWCATGSGPAPWWGAGGLTRFEYALWPWQLLGFFGLLLVFPDGLLPGRIWRLAALTGPVAALLITLTQGFIQGDPTPMRLIAVLTPMVLLLATLLTAVTGVVLRYRRGDRRLRSQLRWLLLAAGSVPVLLPVGWSVDLLGGPTEVGYAGFLFGMLVLVPAAVTIAVLRHDLLDIDQLVSGSLAGAVTAVVSAGLFAGVVGIGGGVLAAPAGLTTVAGAFVTALVLLPLHHRVQAVVGRVTNRERTVAVGAVRRFVEQVRTGAAEPEEVEAVLRRALDDPGLQLAVRLPGTSELVDLRGAPVTDDGDRVALHAADADVGALLLGRTSARRRRLAGELALAARLPIEVSRLRVELRASLAEVTASRTRLVQAASVERRRLERDLHDGAQQRVVAVGMQLRSLQHRLDAGADVRGELDRAVAALEDTVAELRRVASGLRPSRLDDGLAAALQGLARDSPLPLQLSVQDVAPGDLSEAGETTAFFVAAEAVANAWKHSGARSVTVRVARTDGRTSVEVCDDGIGGVDPVRALTALRDRVGSVGGRLDVVSPHGEGTRVLAVF